MLFNSIYHNVLIISECVIQWEEKSQQVIARVSSLGRYDGVESASPPPGMAGFPGHETFRDSFTAHETFWGSFTGRETLRLFFVIRPGPGGQVYLIGKKKSAKSN